MPTLGDLFRLDPNVERLTLLPRLRGTLPSDPGYELKGSVMGERYMPDIIAPKILYDFIRAIKAPARAARGEVLDEEEALNVATNLFGGGLTTSGSVPLGSLGMSARTKPAGSIPLREVPRSPLGFYSKVEEATLPLQSKGSGSQFLAQIQKTPGVKPEEIEVLGLDKFLQSKPTVTKQEIQDYITANKPDVQEVQLGTGTVKTFEQWAADQGFGPEAIRDFGPTLRNSYEAFKTNASQKQGAAKFASYTIPGGENYRELLLTLPEPIEAKMFRDLELRVNAGERLKPEELQKYYDLVDAQAFKNQYFGPHYEQANILAHLRANDRVVDGKKALFIEEIQSDWHQAGRKKGYNKLPDDAQVVQSPDTGNFIVQRANGNYLGESAATREEAIQSAIKHFGGVPDAPFKKSWHELALKRAIQEAVDKGYDKLAFTTGKTQAERYDLSKQIDRVAITKTGGVWSVNAWKDGSKVITKDASTDSDLANLVGKELADKAVKQGGGEYAGLDLQVGGEGMKGFYDEILPKALQNLTKKYGTKVTKSKLDEGSEVWSMDITPQMREQVKAKGQPLFATAPPLGLATQDPLEQFLESQEAKNDPFMQFLGYNR